MDELIVSIRSLPSPLYHSHHNLHDLELDRDHSVHHLKPPTDYKEKDRIELCEYKVI